MNSTWLLLLYPSKAVLVEQEVEHAHRDYAVLVAQGPHHIVHKHNLLEAVADAEQGGLLLSRLLGGPHHQRRLDVNAVGTPVGNEVYLELLANVPALLANAFLDHADVHRVPARPKLVVDHVLRDVALLNLPKAEPCVSKPHVFEAVFQGAADVAPCPSRRSAAPPR